MHQKAREKGAEDDQSERPPAAVGSPPFTPLLPHMPVSRLEIRVAWSTPSLSQVPVQITRSPSLTWLASILLVFLLPCSWLTHSVELSYWTIFSSLEPTLRTVSLD